MYAIKIIKISKSDEEIVNNEIKILKKIGDNPYVIKLEDTFMFKNKNSKHLCMVMENLGLDLHILKRLFRYTDYDSDESEDKSIMRCVPMDLAKKITYQI